MNSIILHLDGDIIKARSQVEPITSLCLQGAKYDLENVYFGDWIALRNSMSKIIGFKLVPFVKDDYLERCIWPAKFIKIATNVLVEKKKGYPYISILIEPTLLFTEDEMNRMQAAIFHNHQDDFIVRLDGFLDTEWSQFGFPLI